MKNSPAKEIVRPPVVVVMGHIDHGKSTLLDYIRKTNVTATEAGGITQRVSAYAAGGFTFIDTPGHAAFTLMRERGAQIADLAILVVSAEDGVKPQTLEALKAIVDAKLSYLIAINKMDRPNANLERTKQSLAENNILIEGYGGTIPAVPISAKTGEGIPELLEMLKLLAEMGEFKADPRRPASGFVLETNRDPKQGVTATLIIKNGSLRLGDFLVAGQSLAKVKRLNDFAGQAVSELGPAAPAQVVGFADLPPVGSSFLAYADKKSAEQALAAAKRPTAQLKPATTTENPDQVIVPIFIKTDLAGSLEAAKKEILKQQTETVRIAIVGEGVGQITENDVKLAGGSDRTILLGFNVEVQPSARELAIKLGITLQTFDIIYKLAEWLAEEVARRAPKITAEQVVGRAKILKYFSAARSRQVVGGVVTLGVINLNKPVRILRRESEIGRGKIVELQQQKLAVKEVELDKQFGAMVDSKVTLAAGDTLEIVELVEQ